MLPNIARLVLLKRDDAVGLSHGGACCDEAADGEVRVVCAG